MSAPSELEDRAAALRRAFDEAFALPPAARAPTDDFLAIRVAGDRFALRVASIARIAETPKIVPVPSRKPAVLGVAAVRGALVSVHSLAMLLGYDAQATAAPPRWMALVVVPGADAIGLAFDDIEGFLRVPHGAQGVLEAGGITRTILDVSRLTEAIGTGNAGSSPRSHA